MGKKKKKKQFQSAGRRIPLGQNKDLNSRVLYSSTMVTGAIAVHTELLFVVRIHVIASTLLHLQSLTPFVHPIIISACIIGNALCK